MIIDANTNVGPTVYSDFELSPDFESLSDRLSQLGVDGAVVAPLKPPSFDFDSANENLAKTLSDCEDYYGIGRIDPRVEDAMNHAEAAVSEYGLHGLKLHPWEETYSIADSMVEPVLEVADDLDVPVWVHAGYPGVSHALSVRRVAKEYSDVEFVLTHSSQLDISGGSIGDVMLLAQETENTYFELSGIYRHDFIQDIVETVGPERVLFGSNSPYYNIQVEKSRVTEADLAEEEKSQLLGKSIQGLLR